MPTSPNYFDLLSDKEDHPETAPQLASKPQNAVKTVRFAEPPQVNSAWIFSGDDDDDECATPSADEAKERAAPADAAPDRGPCPTPVISGFRTRRPDSKAAPSRKRPAAEATMEANAFLETILNGDADPDANGASGIG